MNRTHTPPAAPRLGWRPSTSAHHAPVLTPSALRLPPFSLRPSPSALRFSSFIIHPSSFSSVFRLSSFILSVQRAGTHTPQRPKPSGQYGHEAARPGENFVLCCRPPVAAPLPAPSNAWPPRGAPPARPAAALPRTRRGRPGWCQDAGSPDPDEDLLQPVDFHRLLLEGHALGHVLGNGLPPAVEFLRRRQLAPRVDGLGPVHRACVASRRGKIKVVPAAQSAIGRMAEAGGRNSQVNGCRPEGHRATEAARAPLPLTPPPAAAAG